MIETNLRISKSVDAGQVAKLDPTSTLESLTTILSSKISNRKCATW
jgi:hypothetical protein